MPWREVSVMDQRREFVRLAMQEGANRRELCRRFNIHPDTGYKWLARWQADQNVNDRSRRPHASPGQTDCELEARILAVRDAHPAWGARKIAHCLERNGLRSPAVSTVHQILRRSGRIKPPIGGPMASQRFEMPAPNLLWQMDFKGWVRLGNDTQCHPLTVVDDHSRYDLCLQACADQRTDTVRSRLEKTFRHYGLPEAFFVDNGSPWGDPSGERWTRFSVWLLKLGVAVIRSRPYHPQSRGKNERFHRTLAAEVFALRQFRDLAETQRAFDAWREVYNFERPHEALGQQVPASRYRPSQRPMPDRLPQVEYDSHEIVRRVSTTKAYVSFKGRLWKVPQAFRGERLAIRPSANDAQYGIFFAAHQIAIIDLASGESVGYVPEHPSVMSPG
ncbi:MULTISPECIES: IS481 family transposase [Bradyrhizobium]|nr:MULTISPECIES: IS481 family transposase [Bradyrhizobium]UQR59872.1 IS481 family transposase [Bradyrhizobium sp. C-145]UQR62801.1 IS481 family transposase [Bradyrhizobium sp. C-145]UQR63905.1 IS481 family transposase [Bradyrhizobium sp. C-145]UQR64479.1 IS481 family transposase [Bradyrhizobium sp. C-145]UQR64633.1 IS481 family transposase [Bradyrhizobium sp. C-145]